MKVIWSRNAQKDLRRFAHDVRARLARQVEGLADGFEHLDVKRLQGRRGKVYRVRFGDVRVVVERLGLECHVLEVVDRKDAY